jgi:hypothetical protein
MDEPLRRDDPDAAMIAEREEVIVAAYNVFDRNRNGAGDDHIVVWVTRHRARRGRRIDYDGRDGEEVIAETLLPRSR